jgi:hypothetical protein
MTCLSVRTRSVGSITSVDSYKKNEKMRGKKEEEPAHRIVRVLVERLGRHPVPVIDIFTAALIGADNFGRTPLIRY